MRNSVIVVDGDDEKMNKVDIARDEENIKKYGLLQYMVKQEKNNQDKSAKKGREKTKSNKTDKKEDKKNNKKAEKTRVKTFKRNKARGKK